MIRFLILSLFILFPFTALSEECQDIFGSKLYYEREVAIKRAQFESLHPTHTDPIRDRELVSAWNIPPPHPRFI